MKLNFTRYKCFLYSELSVDISRIRYLTYVKINSIPFMYSVGYEFNNYSDSYFYYYDNLLESYMLSDDTPLLYDDDDYMSGYIPESLQSDFEKCNELKNSFVKSREYYYKTSSAVLKLSKEF